MTCTNRCCRYFSESWFSVMCSNVIKVNPEKQQKVSQFRTFSFCVPCTVKCTAAYCYTHLKEKTRLNQMVTCGTVLLQQAWGGETQGWYFIILLPSAPWCCAPLTMNTTSVTDMDVAFTEECMLLKRPDCETKEPYIHFTYKSNPSKMWGE